MVSEPRGVEAARRVSGPAGREAGSIWKERRPSAEAAVARHSLTRRPSGPSAWIMMAASGAARPAMARGRPGLAWSCFAGYKATGTIWPTERSVMVRAGTEGDAEKTTRRFCTAPGGEVGGQGDLEGGGLAGGEFDGGAFDGGGPVVGADVQAGVEGGGGLGDDGEAGAGLGAGGPLVGGGAFVAPERPEQVGLVFVGGGELDDLAA